jgi:Lamin Tail Domain
LGQAKSPNHSAVWVSRRSNSGVKIRIRALLIAGVAVALTSIALPANAASAIQFGKIYYDQPGSDTPITNTKLNNEYVVIKNTGTTTRTMTGWTVRDLANHVYTFPSFKLGAGKSVTLHTGKGTNTSSHLYWGKGGYIWNNTGDKAIVRDSTGALKDTCTWGDGIGYKYC